LVVVAAGVELLGTVEPAINKVGGQIHRERPVRRVGRDECHPVSPQELDKVARAEALMTDLDRVAQRPFPVRYNPVTPVKPLVMTTRKGGRRLRILRQKRQEGVEALWIELHMWRELPENGAQLRPQPQRA